VEEHANKYWELKGSRHQKKFSNNTT